MGFWETKGYKIVAVDTTTEVCTGAAKEILEKMIKKSVGMSKSWMPESPPEKFVLPLSQWSNKALKVSHYQVLQDVHYHHCIHHHNHCQHCCHLYHLCELCEKHF